MSRRAPKRALLLGLCAALALLFTGLGIWQLERLRWKLDLIERVEARVTAAPLPVPGRSDWHRLDKRDIEYRRVQATGRLDRSRSTLVDALTERGAGNWLLTPLLTGDGTILVNEGFVPKKWRMQGLSSEPVRLSGLLRLTEPGGRFLRPNDPRADRWFSRDIAAIARAREITDAAPFFIDAEATGDPDSYPIGGLTVVRFRNAHLIYALTWFGLAALSLFGLALTWKSSQTRS